MCLSVYRVCNSFVLTFVRTISFSFFAAILVASFWGLTAGTVDSEGRIFEKEGKSYHTHFISLFNTKKEAEEKGDDRKRKRYQ